MRERLMKYLRIHILLWAWLLVNGGGQAQTYLTSMRYYGIEEGLSHSQVMDVHKDQQGMMWVLARDQINRFDGQNFKPIAHQSFFSFAAEIVGEDSERDLWIVNAYRKNDILFFNTKTETFRSFRQKFKDTPLAPQENIINYHINTEGQWLFGTSNGRLLHYHPETQQLQSTFIGAGLRVRPFFTDARGNHWLRASTSTDVVDPAELVVVNAQGEVSRGLQSSNVIFNTKAIDSTYWHYNSRDSLYISNLMGTRAYDLQEFSNRVLPTTYRSQYHFIRHDSIHGHYWWANEENMTVFHPENGLLVDLLELFPELAHTNVLDVFLDERGVAWLATINGLYELNCRPNQFQQYLYLDPERTRDEDLYSCRGICSDFDGRIFANADSYSLELDEDSIKVISEGYLLPFWENYLDRQGNYWISAPDTLLQYQEQELVKKWPMPIGSIWAMAEGRKGLWLGISSVETMDTTLVCLDAQAGQWTAFEQHNGFDELQASRIYAIQPSRDSTFFWLVTTKGLFVLDEERGIQARYWTGGEGKYKLPHDDLRHLHEDDDGLLWLASTQGLLCINRGQQSCRHYTEDDGLSHNNLYAVYEDDFGFLWLSSDYGIIQFQKSTERTKIYLPSDGITYHEFNRIAHHQITQCADPSQVGRIFFGGLNGISAFHPRDFVKSFDDQPDLPLLLLECNVFSGKTNQVENIKPDFLSRQLVEIYPGDQFLNIELALLDYVNPKLISYEYRIEGFNDVWTTSKENTLLISGLPYGTFDLVVRAKTGNGLYSKQELRVPIKVLRPFYRQWWFALILLGLLALGIWTVYGVRTRQLLQQKVKLEREVRERTQTIARQSEALRQLDKVKSRFFANVSHELRTPLTLILAPLQRVLALRKDKDQESELLSTAYQNAKNLLKLTNEILDLSKLEASKLELVETPVFFLSEVRRIFSSFESRAYHQGINFQILNRLNPDLRIQLDKPKFEKILNNLLSNALKFTPSGGSVILELDERGDKIRLQVADTGTGISAKDLPHIFERYYQSKDKNAITAGGTGIGLALSKEIAKLFRGKLWAESEKGQGSRFIFEFPLKRISTETTPPAEVIEEQPPAVHSEHLKTSVLPPNGSHPTILVVEDHSDLRNFLRVMLEANYQVLTAEHGQQALDILGSSQGATIRLILSDVMMPVMDGFELVQQLKTDAKYAAIPVVMLTARAELQDKLKALRIGVDDYILKPFEEEEVLVRIRNLLEQTTIRDRYRQELLEAEGNPTMPKVAADASAILTLPDQEWLTQVEEAVRQELNQPEFKAEQLAQHIYLSRRQLDRRLKTLTGLTAGEYIREVRLQQARQFLEQRSFSSVRVVALEVGFKSHSHFSKQYKERFGKRPSEYF